MFVCFILIFNFENLFCLISSRTVLLAEGPCKRGL